MGREEKGRELMPIRTMEVRFPRLGFISVGHQTTSAKSGKIHPTTTDTITFHASKRSVLHPIATKYGGTVVESPTSTEEQERFFVVTEAKDVRVMVPADLDVAFSQYYESWASSGLVRRCDGIDCVLWRRDPKGDEKVGELSHAIRPCLCEEEGAEERMCKPTVRLSVVPIDVAPDIPDIGVFTVRSTGFFTNSELLGDLELIRAVVGSLGAGVPLRLSVEMVRSRRGNKPKFRLGLAGTPREIMGQLGSGARPMLVAPVEADVEDETPVGRFIDKPAGADGGQDDAKDAASEPSGSDANPSAPEAIDAPDVVTFAGVDIPHVGGTKRGRDVQAIRPAQLKVMQRLAADIGTDFSLEGAFNQFAGFEIGDTSLETAQAFIDYLRGQLKEVASA